MKILLIIPAYNEESNILNVYNDINKYNSSKKNIKVDYVVINDCSSDNTLKMLKENKINHINLISNLGIGGAVQTGYKYALINNYDIAIQFDGDGQHDVNYIEELCKPILDKKSNISVGSRYLDEKTSKFKSSFMRRLGKNIISIIIKIFNGIKITDPTSGFRAVDKNVIRLFSEDYPTDYPEPESIVNVVKSGYKIVEVPVSMNEREEGKSSITPLKSTHYMIKVCVSIIIDSLRFKKKGKVN